MGKSDRQKAYEQFMANVDAGDDAANDDLVRKQDKGFRTEDGKVKNDSTTTVDGQVVKRKR